MDDKWKEQIMDLRHSLHERPELSGKEEGTRKAILLFLQENSSAEILSFDGGMAAYLPGEKILPPIAFRCELDALPIQEDKGLSYASKEPGISHACGHDGHMAAMCALVLELDGQKLSRDVYVLFQEAEEVGRGGEKGASFVKEKGIAEIYAFHNLPGYPLGTMVYRHGLTQPASEGLLLSFHGAPSHASAPEKGKNPAQLIASLALYSQELPGKQEGMALCTIVGMKAGEGDFGISPGEGTLSLTLRAEREEAMKSMEQALITRARDQAMEQGIEVETEIFDYFPETKNDEGTLGKVLEAAGDLSLPVIEMKELWRASEDFGYYGKVCPSAMVYLGAGEDHAPLHTVCYDFPDELLSIAVELFTRVARTS
ncbi:MAG: amidohydrolase [Blautia sp.]|nr:amidohydrolase [Blautia sp.]